MKSLKNTSGGTNVRTDRDLKMPVVLGIILIVIILIWLVPSVPVSLLGAFLIAIFGFFFATVSSRMVGLIGSSNNPVSGMAIATLLISTFVLKATGNTGMAGMTGAIAIGSIICVIAAIAGDTSQDLKTGFIVGATPAKQQVGELIGVVASGFAIAGVMSLLNKAWGFGSAEIPAPQATLMKMIVEGIMDAKLPWVLVFMGVFLALALEVLRVPVMPFAIGLYLPIYLSCGIMVGGVVRLFLDKKKEAEAKKKEMISNGTLYCAGMIAGEGLVGILMAVLAIIKVGDNSIGAIIGGLFNLSGAAGNIVGLIVLALMILSLLKFSVWSKQIMRDKRNYLDFVPVKNPQLPWQEDEGAIVTVEVTHRGLAAKVAQIAFNRPKVSHIHMDAFGSFIWKEIDGEQNIYEIGQKVKEHFGKEAEPLYERLTTFFRILAENKYITYKK